MPCMSSKPEANPNNSSTPSFPETVLLELQLINNFVQYGAVDPESMVRPDGYKDADK